MKKMLTILATMVFALAFGVAFADDLPIMNTKDIGTELYEGAFAPYTTEVSGVAAGGIRTEGDESWRFFEAVISPHVESDQLPHELALPGNATMTGEAGVAAGGVRTEEDEGWKFFEKVISPYKESDQLL